MAPTSAAPSGAPTSADFDGDEFSNNLFSDLAPLLTLFGEQVTKQFLSMSLGWADHILLAMGPLGIITIVVSAIRVSGPRKLKAIIGRAHESLTTAEVELLSSTSHNVCELWDGNQIVRTIGRPEGMKELIIVPENDEHGKAQSGVLQVLDLAQAVDRGYLEDSGRGKPQKNPEELMEQAPNITLNVDGATLPRTQLWFCAAVGLVLQTAALIIPGFTVYSWKWKKGGEDIAAYGYPCFISGSLAIILGVVGCSWVIEKRTEETLYWPPKGREISHIVRVQKGGTIRDQHVQSYAIMNETWDSWLRTSRLKTERGDPWSLIAAISTLVTISGYIVQFVGLRSLHWSATIIQLGVTLAMACFRALVRRGLTNTPVCLPLTKRYENSSLALALTSDRARGELFARRFDFVQSWTLYSRRQDSNWNSTDLPEITTGPIRSNKVVSLHTSLSKSLQQPLETCKWTSRLCAAVEGIMKHLMSTEDISLKNDGALSTGHLAWTISIIRRHLTDSSPDKFSGLTVGMELRPVVDPKDPLKGTNVWRVDANEIKSILDLCVFSIISTIHGSSDCLLPSGIFRRSLDHEILQKGSYSRILGKVRLDDDNSNTLGNWIDFRNFLLALQDDLRPVETPHVPLDAQSRDTPPDDFEPQNALPYFPTGLRDCGLREALSLELMNLFLLAISSQISRINGTTQINADTRFKADERVPDKKGVLQPHWTNTAINELSSCIVEARLVKDLDEANTFVIPALYQYDLLPKEPTPTTVDNLPGQPEGGSGILDREPSNGSSSSMLDHDEKTKTPTSQSGTTG